MHGLTKDLAGQKFGMLMVIRYDESRNNKVYWICQCDCGNTVSVRAQKLKESCTKSCGCYRKQRMRKENNTSYLNRLFHRYKGAAKDRDLEFLLTKDEFKSLIILKCHYCGSTPIISKLEKERNFNGIFPTNGIGRKDNKVGYILENYVPCCTICNIGKRDRTYNEFIEYLERIRNYRNGFGK
jgi:hypothetical protein